MRPAKVGGWPGEGRAQGPDWTERASAGQHQAPAKWGSPASNLGGWFLTYSPFLKTQPLSLHPTTNSSLSICLDSRSPCLVPLVVSQSSGLPHLVACRSRKLSRADPSRPYVCAHLGIGQPLALLLKQNSEITELALFDVVPVVKGVAQDISHCNTPAIVTGYTKDDDGLKDALTGAQVVVIPAGVPRKPGTSTVMLEWRGRAGIRLVRGGSDRPSSLGDELIQCCDCFQ